jgi:thiamine pyrophosphate-dependent acetolactate synthase large subunit-like protein
VAETVRQLIDRLLATAGVTEVFEEPDPNVASIFADAAGRLGPAPGAAWLPDQVLRLSSRPSPGVEPVVVRDAGDVAGALAAALDIAADVIPGTTALRFDLDLDGAAPATTRRTAGLQSRHVDVPDVPRPGRTIVLAGPGVLRAGAIDGLRALAERAGLAVINTWGAKGVFDWQSPNHGGTAGLQERDFELCGFADVDLIIATGVDFDESPRDRWALAPVLDVDPVALAPLAEAWDRPPDTPERPEIYTALSAVVMPMFERPGTPPHAVAQVKAALPPGGIVIADPGPAGFWVARTFPTSELGSVVVPATTAPGFAAAAAVVAGRRGRPAVAVTTAPTDETTGAVLEAAARRGVGVDLRAWDENIDWSCLDSLVAVAGNVVAWT